MKVRWRHLCVILTSSLVLIWNFIGCTGLEYIESSMTSKDCESSSSKTIWISEKTNAIITGKHKDNLKSCQLRFGLATTQKSARIQLNFEFLHIGDCLIQIQINESLTEDFKESSDNKELLTSKCNTRTPGPIFAQPKHFVLISLIKNTTDSDSFNFYLNITMAGDPPSTGLELHVLIIVAFVAFVLVIVAGVLLFKYITRLSERWHEERVDAAMTCAISIYNSQEPLEEQDMVPFTPRAKRTHQNGSITHVHADGRIERFYPFDNDDHGNERVSLPSPSHKSSECNRRPMHQTALNDYVDCNRLAGATQLKAVLPTSSSPQPPAAQINSGQGHIVELGDNISMGGCDMPPSYEEALDMPGPSSLLPSRPEPEVVLATQGLQQDYMNFSSSDCNELGFSDSGEMLLLK